MSFGSQEISSSPVLNVCPRKRLRAARRPSRHLGHARARQTPAGQLAQLSKQSQTDRPRPARGTPPPYAVCPSPSRKNSSTGLDEAASRTLAATALSLQRQPTQHVQIPPQHR